ncbi:MAG: LysR family transcriptional regulator [Planktomarina sp.]
MRQTLTLKQLRSLKSTVKTGTLSDAAAEQLLTAPAIHSQIKKLEDIVGAPVITKDASERRFGATPHGTVLINAIDRIEGILAAAFHDLKALDEGKTGFVSIGFESTGRYFAPSLVAFLRQVCPTINISFKVANRSQIIEEIATEQIDLAFMGRPPRQPLVNAHPVGPHPYGVVLPAGHPLSKLNTYSPEQFLKYPILAREKGSGTRTHLDRFIGQIDAYGRPEIIEYDSNETIKEAVMANLGIAMMSLHVAQRELQEGKLVLLKWPKLPVMRYWYLVSLKRNLTPENARQVQDVILAENGSFLPATKDLGLFAR